MGTATVITTTTLIFILLIPLRADSYVYINTAKKYAGINVVLWKVLRVFNANTVENSPMKFEVNGRERSVDKSFLKSNALKIFNNLSITSVVQLGDYGTAGGGAYAAAIQHALTQTAYSFIELNSGSALLKNYTILNEQHGDVIYYAKLTGFTNLLAVIKLAVVLFAEKIHEQS